MMQVGSNLLWCKGICNVQLRQLRHSQHKEISDGNHVDSKIFENLFYRTLVIYLKLSNTANKEHILYSEDLSTK